MHLEVSGFVSQSKLIAEQPCIYVQGMQRASQCPTGKQALSCGLFRGSPRLGQNSRHDEAPVYETSHGMFLFGSLSEPQSYPPSLIPEVSVLSRSSQNMRQVKALDGPH